MVEVFSKAPTLFVDTIFNPTYDLLHEMVTSLVAHGNSTNRNNYSRYEGMAMTDDEVKFYFVLKSAWIVLSIIMKIIPVFVVAYWLYKLLFVPYEKIRRLGSIGYVNHENIQLSKKELANVIRKRRKLGDNLPPVYPNGWFKLLDSIDLKNGQVKEVSAMGEHFAVYRSKTGNANVLDAYCPHMGGNLAVGGLVKGECLECPFHAWKFNGEGKCVDIPYSDKIPSFVKTKSWHSNEVNGGIYVWYHCDGKDPEWEIPVVEEIASGNFKHCGRVEHHVNSHIQEIPENGSDLAHLDHVHLPFFLAGSDNLTMFTTWINIGSHMHKAASLGSPKGKPHISLLELTHCIELFKKWQFLHLDFKIHQIGPGIVHMYFCNKLFSGVFVQSLTPAEPLHQVLSHSIYISWHVPMFVGKLFLHVEAIQVDRDIMIWNNKTYHAKPKLLKEDKLIPQFRRWYSQFYTENSPRLQMKAADSIDW